MKRRMRSAIIMALAAASSTSVAHAAADRAAARKEVFVWFAQEMNHGVVRKSLPKGFVGLVVPPKFQKADVNHDQVVSEADLATVRDLVATAGSMEAAGLRGRLAVELAVYDMDCDAVVTLEEAVSAAEQEVAVANAAGTERGAQFVREIRSFFAGLDTDGDGKVSGSEMLGYLRNASAQIHGSSGGQDEVLVRTILALDADGDGRVTPAELAGAAEEVFDEVDLNHDGAIDQAEVDAGMARFGLTAIPPVEADFRAAARRSDPTTFPRIPKAADYLR